MTTYRIQFTEAFTSRDAAALTGYLARLGATALYASPLQAARPGSTHGYDGVEPTRWDEARGGVAGFRALSSALRRRKLELVLDIVPNHLGADAAHNPWWRELLTWGPAAPHARHFDVDWQAPEAEGRVLLPVLGDSPRAVWEQEALRIALVDGGAAGECQLDLRVYGESVPLTPGSWSLLLEPLAGHPASAPEAPSLRRLLRDLSACPTRQRPRTRAAEDWPRVGERLVRRLARLLHQTPTLREALQAELHRWNHPAAVAREATWARWEALLAVQFHEPAFWREGLQRLNYRRFFDVDGLAGLCVERPEVFAESHALLLGEVAAGRIQGLRIDHPDGLRDPAGYLRRLERACTQALRQGGLDHAASLPLWVEKILEPGEDLRRDWPVAGTTGYGFLNVLNGLFVHPAGERPLREGYARLTGERRAFPDILAECKAQALDDLFTPELTALTTRLAALLHAAPGRSGLPEGALRCALRAVLVAFPVYRSYRRPAERRLHPEDAAVLRRALDAAEERLQPPEGIPPTDCRVALAALRRHLLAAPRAGAPPVRRLRWALIQALQQLSGPAMAKGLEDTAFYRHAPLLSLNAVGGGPAGWSTSTAAFHRFAEDRQRNWPRAMNATATHDSKRGEDARARLNVLSELPEEWNTALRRWRRLNAPHRTRLGRGTAPDATDELFLYQALLGAWPMEALEGGLGLDSAAGRDLPGRMADYAEKALREAKRRSSWLAPDEDYEAAVQRFLTALLDARGPNPFLADFGRFLTPVLRAGVCNSLVQTLFKCVAPGQPDVYQGTELWDLSLVDPDNRRPVDFDLRRRLLAGLPVPGGDGGAAVRALLEAPADGRVKLHVLHRALMARRAHPRLFTQGVYRPVAVRGPRAEHVLAFARQWGRHWAIAVGGRAFHRLGCWPPLGAVAWEKTDLTLPAALKGARLRDVLSGMDALPDDGRFGPTLAVGTVFSNLPVALLITEGL